MTTAPAVGHPLSFRLLLDDAMRHARRHFRRIYPAVAVPLSLTAGLMTLGQSVFFRSVMPGGRTAPRPADLVVGFGAFAAGVAVFTLVYTLGYGALLVAAVDALAEREVSMRRAWRFMARPRVLGTLLLSALAAAVGFVFCILPGLYVGLLLSLTVPVIVEEGLFGTRALRRSAELARYNPQREFDEDPRLRVFLIFLVGTLLGYVVNFVVQLPVVIVQQVMMFREVAGGRPSDPGALMARLVWLQVPSQMVGMLTNTAVHLYVSFGVALLFFDVKRRKEGLDLEAAIARLVETHRARRQP